MWSQELFLMIFVGPCQLMCSVILWKKKRALFLSTAIVISYTDCSICSLLKIFVFHWNPSAILLLSGLQLSVLDLMIFWGGDTRAADSMQCQLSKSVWRVLC